MTYFIEEVLIFLYFIFLTSKFDNNQVRILFQLTFEDEPHENHHETVFF